MVRQGFCIRQCYICSITVQVTCMHSYTVGLVAKILAKCIKASPQTPPRPFLARGNNFNKLGRLGECYLPIMKALNPVALDKITFYFAYVHLCTLKHVITEVGSFLAQGPVRTNMVETHLVKLNVH